MITVRREETFDAAEFEARRERVRALMAERGLDTLLLHSPSNIYYLSGHYTLNLIRADGSIKVGCHDISYEELHRMAIQLEYTK